MQRRFTLICCLCFATFLTAQDSIQYKLGSVKLLGEKNSQPDSFLHLRENVLVQSGLNTSAEALGLFSGTQFTRGGDRNEELIFVRGFDLRQVPLLIDGIPVYIPFDGYVDLGRFTLFDYSEISIQKGLSSVTSGPNALGGTINLITSKPQHQLELKGLLGGLNNGYRGHVSLGQSKKSFYWQASYNRFERSSFPLSGSYTPNNLEDGGKRNNAFNIDQRMSAKIGFTPNARHEHSITFARQMGEKGNPLYAGADSMNPRFSRPRFWQWPYWNKTSLYYLGEVQLQSSSALKLRAYYDQFDNKLQSFDNDQFNSQTRRYAFNSIYKDRTYGANASYSRKLGQKHAMIASGHVKFDEHQEKDDDSPWRTMSDLSTFFGLEDEFSLNEDFKIRGTLSVAHRSSLAAEDALLTNGEFTDFESNTSSALNGGISVIKRVNKNLQANLSVARNTRFATLKDRYSYRLGTAIPNPDLLPENALQYEAGMSGRLAKWHYKWAIFYSDIRNSLQMVENVAFDSSNNALSQQQNVGEARFYGIDIDIERRFQKGFQIKTNYSYLERENLSLENFEFTLVPQHQFNAILRMDNDKPINLQAVIKAQSESFSTSYGTTADAFVLLNLFLEYEVNKVFKVQAYVNNVLDNNYERIEGFPEPGRNYNLSLIWNWHKG